MSPVLVPDRLLDTMIPWPPGPYTIYPSPIGPPLEVLPIYTVPLDMYYIMDYYYWHIVEIVYIYIYITLYCYYGILCQSQCYSYSSC